MKPTETPEDTLIKETQFKFSGICRIETNVNNYEVIRTFLKISSI